jgi:hypothetical protein
MNLDDRLRAAGNALREGSAAQVDAAGSLREILLHTDPVTDEPTGPPGPSPAPRAARLSGRPQRRLALAVNLLLVLALGVTIGTVLPRDRERDPRPAAPSPAAPRVSSAGTMPSTAIVPQTTVVTPGACLAATELADDVIAKLNRNVRDQRLFLALRDYTIASQACRREASP